MSDDRIKRALGSVGDRYIQENPADYEAFREGVRRRSRRKWTVTGLSGVAVAGLAIAAFAFVMSARPDSAGLQPAQPGEDAPGVTVQLSLGEPADVIAAGTTAWTMEPGSGIVRQIENSGEQTWVAELPGPPADLVRDSESVWLTVPSLDAVYRLEIATGAMEEVSLGDYTDPTRLHVGARAARIVTGQGVVRLDIASGSTDLLYPGDVTDIAMGNSAFWVLESSGSVVAIDPDTGAPVRALEDAFSEGGEITFLREKVWFGAPGSAGIYGFAEASDIDSVATTLPGSYIDIDANRSGLWVLHEQGSGGVLQELDPTDGSVESRSYEFDSRPRDLATDEHGLWVTLDNGDLVHIEI